MSLKSFLTSLGNAVIGVVGSSAMATPDKEAHINNIQSSFQGAIADVEQALAGGVNTATNIAESVADTAINQIAGPFASLADNAANTLIDEMGGNLNVAISHLFGIATVKQQQGQVITNQSVPAVVQATGNPAVQPVPYNPAPQVASSISLTGAPNLPQS